MLQLNHISDIFTRERTRTFNISQFPHFREQAKCFSCCLANLSWAKQTPASYLNMDCLPKSENHMRDTFYTITQSGTDDSHNINLSILMIVFSIESKVVRSKVADFKCRASPVIFQFLSIITSCLWVCNISISTI